MGRIVSSQKLCEVLSPSICECELTLRWSVSKYKKVNMTYVLISRGKVEHRHRRNMETEEGNLKTDTENNAMK